MNRKEGLVSSSTLRRRARADVDRSIREIRDVEASVSVNFEVDNLGSDCHSEESCGVSYLQMPVHASFDCPSIDGIAEDCESDSLSIDGTNEDSECDRRSIDGIPEGWESAGEDDDKPNLADKLANWAVKFGVSLVALSALLCILCVHHPELPKDTRTLLKTKTHYEVSEKCGGEYYYFGILKSLQNTLSRFQKYIVDGCCLMLQINIDGLMLFKSSNLQLWPILGLLLNVPMKEPVVIGLFCGSRKPKSSDEFLDDFVKELNALENGFSFSGKQISLKVSSVVCDTPARAFVKNTKSHNAYHGCDKCTQQGTYLSHRMVFPSTEFTPRTDESFAFKLDEGHHNGPSPFDRVHLGMVSQFPLDYMHLVCLGVVRRLVNIWLRGALKFRMPAFVVDKISDTLIHLREHLPSEFSRKPRSLREVDHWKATEFRQFLLYTGPVVLSSDLDTKMYHNFMLLSSAISILISPKWSKTHSDYAHNLLRTFVSYYGQIYGTDLIVYNVHGLLHLTEDVKQHGHLDRFSAFPYENYLHNLKKLVRKPECPVAQIIRRLSEQRLIDDVSTVQASLKKQHFVGPVPDGLSVKAQYREMQCENFSVKVSTGNNTFVIENEVGVVHNIVECSDGVYVVYKVFRDRSLFFSYPFDSTFLGIFRVSGPQKGFRFAEISKVRNKCALLPHRESFVVIPLLH